MRGMNVKLTLVLSWLLSAFAVAAVAPTPPVSDHFYLNTNQIAPKALSFFDNAFKSPARLTMAQVSHALEVLDGDSQYMNVTSKYHSELQKFMKIGEGRPFADIEAWQKGNPALFEGIRLYVDSPVNGSPVWQSLNANLRAGRPLAAGERRALNKILTSLDQIPSIKGIVFRGATLLPEKFSRYVKGTEITEPSFTSTSVSSNVAQGYADISAPVDFNGRPVAGKVSTIFIIKAKQAAPVTAFMSDYYFEFEGLIRPGARFKVHHVLINLAGRQSYIFLEQL